MQLFNGGRGGVNLQEKGKRKPVKFSEEKKG